MCEIKQEASEFFGSKLGIKWTLRQIHLLNAYQFVTLFEMFVNFFVILFNRKIKSNKLPMNLD